MLIKLDLQQLRFCRDGMFGEQLTDTATLNSERPPSSLSDLPKYGMVPLHMMRYFQFSNDQSKNCDMRESGCWAFELPNGRYCKCMRIPNINKGEQIDAWSQVRYWLLLLYPASTRGSPEPCQGILSLNNTTTRWLGPSITINPYDISFQPQDAVPNPK